MLASEFRLEVSLGSMCTVCHRPYFASRATRGSSQSCAVVRSSAARSAFAFRAVAAGFRCHDRTVHVGTAIHLVCDMAYARLALSGIIELD